VFNVVGDEHRTRQALRGIRKALGDAVVPVVAGAPRASAG